MWRFEQASPERPPKPAIMAHLTAACKYKCIYSNPNKVIFMLKIFHTIYHIAVYDYLICRICLWPMLIIEFSVFASAGKKANRENKFTTVTVIFRRSKCFVNIRMPKQYRLDGGVVFLLLYLKMHYSFCKKALQSHALRPFFITCVHWTFSRWMVDIFALDSSFSNHNISCKLDKLSGHLTLRKANINCSKGHPVQLPCTVLNCHQIWRAISSIIHPTRMTVNYEN